MEEGEQERGKREGYRRSGESGRSFS